MNTEDPVIVDLGDVLVLYDRNDDTGDTSGAQIVAKDSTGDDDG